MVPDPRLAVTAERFGRTTTWTQVDELPIRFDAGHPQGMARIGREWWISTADITSRRGFVLTVDRDGALVTRTPVGDATRFHPGGMDYDGSSLWVASSEYRPRSSAVIERLVPDGSSTPEFIFRVDDHVGAVVRLGARGDLVGWTWGSRRFLRWRVDGSVVAEVRNPGQFIDHQDGQWLGDDLVLCGGVATFDLADGPRAIGGIGLLRGTDLTMVCEAPFPKYSPATGRAATQNPIWAEVDGDAMVVHLLPDDGRGSILSYATPLR
jgi:hypothetical protein